MATKSYYGLSSQSADIANANNLTSTGGGSTPTPTTGNQTFNFTGWMELQSHGGSTGVHGAIGSPDGRGFILDTSELTGITTPAGVWTALIKLISSAATATGDVTVRFYDLDLLGAVYTELGEATLTSQSITTTGTALTLATASLAAHTWASGHNLYMDIWINQTGGGSAGNLISIEVASTSAGVPAASGGYEITIPDGTSSFTVGMTHAVHLRGSMATGFIAGQTAATHLPMSVALRELLPTPTLPPPKMPIISQGKPSYETGGFFPAANGNDALYGTTWRSVSVPSIGSPQRFTIDLSTVPAIQRGVVVVNLLNEIGNQYVDPAGDVVASLFSDYTLEANAGAGGGVAPGGGWVTLVQVTGNTYHTRQHIIDLTGYNWLRMSCTATLGTNPNDDLEVQIDIHDAHLGLADRWLFAGDSITAEQALHGQLGGGDWGPAVPGALSQVLNNSYTYGQYYPAIIDGGFGGMTAAAASVQPFLGEELNGFTGGFVVVAYGTNDCNQGFAYSPGDTNVTTYYAHLLTIIDAALALNNVVIVPKIPYGTANGGNLGINAGLCNDYVDAHLPTDRPTVLRGPDFWTYYQAHTELLRDGIHPTFAEVGGAADGYEQMHVLWAQWMAQNVYLIQPIPGTVAVSVVVNETVAVGFTNDEA